METELEVDPGNARVAMKPLDDSVVHRICSGQIITTLAVAVKELIENSLDAGAKTVEIRFKDHGSSVIEVRDDGSGVERENRAAFALKNYTSKINDFSDIYKLHTYGFRGEAINSLCVIGEVSMITRHEDDECGTFLVYDRSGNIVEETPRARMVGTTVFVKNIFLSLPVRRKLLLTNIKKEFSKAVDIIKAYCLVTTGVRIICTNQIGEKSSTTVVVTDGTSVLNNISSAFGVDQVKNLLAVPRRLPDRQLMEDFRITDDEIEGNEVDFDCYISSCERGEGRNIRDRQFVYVNSRPCDYEKITRLINYMFHQYQKRKYPFLFLNLKLSTDAVDVNCSPDKREIILRNENLVLATIKASLIEIFRSVRSVSTIENNKLPSVQFKLENSFLTVKTNSGHNSFVGEECTVTVDTPEEVVSSMKSSSITETLNENGFLCSRTSTQKTEVSTSCDILFEEECVTTVQYEDNPAACNSRADQRKKIIFDDNKRCYNEHRSQTVIDVGILVDKIEPKEGKRREASDLFKEKHNEILKFRAALDPAQNENAEKELRQQISREMFSKMEVVGQLNKSFIVVHMESDLFIIDQHAADEIYNFENLMKSSTIPNQRLVAPQSLQLLPNQETIVTEYINVFKRNGFEFEVDLSAPPCQRIQLTAVPVSKLWTYGKDDVIELIAMLEECPDVICRPSRIRAMFASRACRKSVMMGSSLTHSIMRNIVDHLGTLDEPWNCPHGRPTMRHLFDLKEMKEKTVEHNLQCE
ncbi:hypothetical protein R5R35_013060 [Gryllus longicercus]|uniref:Mismatch repair endonuclease PMS2 n=1 Tax=Gryllus longicercus TaxID=2509291 RepID=A0AAN9YTY3_9ORTH